MEQTKAQKIKQLLDKKGLNCKVEQSIKDKCKIIEQSKIIEK
jgi:hypothetical protein